MICVWFWGRTTNFDISSAFYKCRIEGALAPPKDANMM